MSLGWKASRSYTFVSHLDKKGDSNERRQPTHFVAPFLKQCPPVPFVRQKGKKHDERGGRLAFDSSNSLQRALKGIDGAG